jgi:hypothetical protein
MPEQILRSRPFLKYNASLWPKTIDYSRVDPPLRNGPKAGTCEIKIG